jgi:transcriptional regulator with XRE-family HTH domain
MKLEEAAERLEKDGQRKLIRYLRSARKHAKLNRLQLAKLSGVPDSNIHRIEHGKQALTPRTLMRLNDAIEDQLYRNHEEQRRQNKLAELSKKYGQLPERELLALAEKEEKAEVENLKAELDRTKRARVREFIERTARGERPCDSPDLKDLGDLILHKWLTDPSFGPLFSEEYERVFAEHPELSHITREQAMEIRGRVKEREAERERLLTALQNARSIEETEARLAAFEELGNSIEESLRREIEQLEKTNELLASELAKANAELND